MNNVIELHSHPWYIHYHIERFKMVGPRKICPYVAPDEYGSHTADIIDMRDFFISKKIRNRVGRISINWIGDNDDNQ